MTSPQLHQEQLDTPGRAPPAQLPPSVCWTSQWKIAPPKVEGPPTLLPSFLGFLRRPLHGLGVVAIGNGEVSETRSSSMAGGVQRCSRAGQVCKCLQTGTVQLSCIFTRETWTPVLAQNPVHESSQLLGNGPPCESFRDDSGTVSQQGHARGCTQAALWDSSGPCQ